LPYGGITRVRVKGYFSPVSETPEPYVPLAASRNMGDNCKLWFCSHLQPRAPDANLRRLVSNYCSRYIYPATFAHGYRARPVQHDREPDPHLGGARSAGSRCAVGGEARAIRSREVPHTRIRRHGDPAW